MLIGELSAITGVPSRTIRFYERRGILPEPDRTAAGYRDYDTQAVNRLRFVRSAQRAGLTLAEIRTILVIRDDGDAPCDHTRTLLESKRDAIADRLRQLTELQDELGRLIDSGRHIGPQECRPGDICPSSHRPRRHCPRGDARGLKSQPKVPM